ncbi:MAG: coproporphyrinogen dehydrogenase HemZ [Clostridia bacterium]|nr:coproporphyrinogen dehydrogenase HemZ [Clostridia bacterium]
MKITLSTPTAHFTADMMDVIRLFFPDAEPTSEADADTWLSHRFDTENEYYVCEFSGWGRTVHLSAPRGTDDPVGSKRVQKRLIKQSLYTLLKEGTGIHPPWGSLTGIRPTRLFYEQLREAGTPEAACERLISLFDVAPEKAALLKRIADTQKELPAPGKQHADIYIGIPFCPSLCSYCSFSSGLLGDGRRVTPYLDALEKDMCQTRALMNTLLLTPRALYIGGGTPTSLDISGFERLMRMIDRFFPDRQETSVEAGRPDTLTHAKLDAIRDRKTRLSINPQSMNDRTLRAIGRNHTARETEMAFVLARSAGFGHINADIIAGLPSETPDDFNQTLEAVAALGPESLTVHTLCLKRASRMRLDAYPLPDALIVSRMIRDAEAAAEAMGLQPYYLYRQKYAAGNLENVGYAARGHICLYNVGMMEETATVLGIGAGAMTKRVIQEENRIERAPSVSDIDTYISHVDQMIARKAALWEGVRLGASTAVPSAST